MLEHRSKAKKDMAKRDLILDDDNDVEALSHDASFGWTARFIREHLLPSLMSNHPGMKVAYIMRGVSGSGKSTLARQLAGRMANGIIHSTDSYFYDSNGDYQFDPSLLSENHQRNYNDFQKSLGRFNVVICDNTNTQEWEYEGYVRSAEAAGYQVVYVVLKPSLRDAQVYADRNTHGVPLDAIHRQIARFEWSH